MKNTIETKADSGDSVLAGFITPAELCRQLGKTRRTLDRWHARGIGPPRLQVERMIFYRVEAVRAWLNSHVQGYKEIKHGRKNGD
jgi:predicted DNA-binding transcriptional regulator AlpA